MISFGKFMEIAANGGFDVPQGLVKKFKRKGSMVHKEDDPSHRIIPFVIHPKMMDFVDQVEKNQNYMKRHGAAMDVLRRLSEQPKDGGMLMVNISNYEAESLASLGRDIASDSEKVFSSKMAPRIKDMAMSWMSFGNHLMKAVQEGIMLAAGKTKNGPIN